MSGIRSPLAARVGLMLLALGFLAGRAAADVLILTDGKRACGEVVEQTKDHVSFRTEVNGIRATLSRGRRISVHRDAPLCIYA